MNWTDMCAAPDNVISKLWAFLGHDHVGSLQQTQHKIWHTIGGNKIRHSDLDGIVEDVSWRQHLSDKDLETIFHVAGKEATTLGYYPDGIVKRTGYNRL